MKLIMATTNIHKVQEVRAILAGTPIELSTLVDHPELPEPPETGDTFEHNAFQKAQYIYDMLHVPVIADDSGIEVDALGGAPGVHSKRFSPEQTHEANNALLLKKLDGIEERTARFRCVLALVADGVGDHVEGTCEGKIAHHASGTEGFGYDPLFLPDALEGRSMADASMSEKNAISHRGKAFTQLIDLLKRNNLL